jgi:hypothetical protein
MLVPTMAFAWWLASLPARTALPVSEATTMAVASEPRGGDWPASVDERLAARREDQAQSLDESETRATKRVLVRSVLTLDMVHTAQTFLDLPMGAERAVELDGRRYLFVLERHYHPPGFVGAPTGWHKGVTIYELVSSPSGL